MYSLFKKNGRIGNQDQPQGKPSNNQNQKPNGSSQGGGKPNHSNSSGTSKPSAKAGKAPYCVYCRNPGHTKDQCEKLATKRKRDGEKTGEEPKEKAAKK